MKKPLRPCREVNCGNLTRDNYCETHKITGEDNARKKRMDYDRYKRDPKIEAFYHSNSWLRVRTVALTRDNHLCQRCLKLRVLQKAEVVHHIIEIREDWNKRLELDNTESLCHACHNRHHKS